MSMVNDISTEYRLYQPPEYLPRERKNKTLIALSTNNFCSVVIPTYNRSVTLAYTLKSLVNQNISSQNFEIIIIDDGSADRTKETIADFQKKYPSYSIQYFYQKNAGPAKARNLGIKESKGNIIFFTDDDCIVPRNWIETILDGYKRYPEAVGVGGCYVPSGFNGKNTNVYSRYLVEHFFLDTLEGKCIKHEIISNDPKVANNPIFANNTANLSFRRSALVKLGGFREDFKWPGCEDLDLSFRMVCAGFKLLYLPFHVHHIQELDLFGFLRVSFLRGANYYLFFDYNRKKLAELNSALANGPVILPYLIRRLLYHKQRFLTVLYYSAVKAGHLFMKNKLVVKTDV